MIVYAIKNGKKKLLDCEENCCIESHLITLFKTKRSAKNCLDFSGKYNNLKIVKVKIEEVEE